MTPRKVPKFRTEQEEANWWDRNRKDLDAGFLKAAGEGKVRRLTREELAARVAGATRVISLRVAEEDLALARQQAARKGLPYQTYLKSLLHQALRQSGSRAERR